MQTCKVNHVDMKINNVYRKENGDIIVNNYCYNQSNFSKKITHIICKSNATVIYKNGENFDLKRTIAYENNFPNLIGCWCNKNLRFKTPLQAQNHGMEKHPEEYDGTDLFGRK